jgi:enterochelin esterase-like enzyme
MPTHRKETRMVPLEVPASPRLVAVQQALLAGEREAVADLWREVERRGAPLVEPIDDDPAQVLVTFLWRASIPTLNVALIQDWGGANHLADQLPFRRLADTDIWYVSRRLPLDTRLLYQISVNDPRRSIGLEDGPVLPGGWRPDPLNPRRHQVIRADPERAGSADLFFSALELPAAPPQPYLARRPGMPAGDLSIHRLSSRILGNERRVWLYSPPGYDPSGPPYPLLLLFDGKSYIDLIPTPTILDNLLAEGRLPPVVAVFPDSLGWEVRARELPCSPSFLAFVVEELLPWVGASAHVSADPTRRLVAGSSLGGLAAVYVGLERPDLFGRVLAQTGAFGWAPPGAEEPAWLTRQIVDRPRMPLRFYLEVGRLETEQPPDGGPSQLTANRHLRDVLRAKGYPVRYREYSGGHDVFNLQGTLADGLMALLAPPASSP